MIVQYNGITLALCKLRGWDRVAEMDGPQYLWTRHSIRVSGVYNPRATSYDTVAGSPSPVQDRTAPVTDLTVRHALGMPRGTLSISVGGTNVLYSPDPDHETDAHNGPIPKVHAVVESIGEKTFLVDWSVEVCINETTGATIPTVLSSRWTMEDHIALPHYLTTRVIQGWATLRSDLMLANGRVPDDFRAALLHPVGTNMQRESIDVAVDDEGTGIEYTLVDQEQMFNIHPAAAIYGVTKIEAYHTAEVAKPGTEEAIVGIGGSLMRTGGHFIDANVLSIPSIQGNLIATGMGAIDLGITIANLIPKKTHTIVARVWGSRLSTRVRLEEIALKICFQRILQSGVSEQAGAVWLQTTHDLMGKWVEVQVRLKQGLDRLNINNAIGNAGIAGVLEGPVAGVENLINGFLNRITTVQQDIMPQGEELNGVATASRFVNPSPANNLNLSGRGSFIGKLVAQVLHDSNQTQTAPPVVPLGVNRAIE